MTKQVLQDPANIVFELEPQDNEQLQNFCGWHNQNIEQIENQFDVEINNLGFRFKLIGAANKLQTAKNLIEDLYLEAGRKTLLPEDVHLLLQEYQSNQDSADSTGLNDSQQATIKLRRKFLKTRNPNQISYVNLMRDKEVNFGIGPAGTGKTYLAVAMAVEALETEKVRRIILTRPAVEAGEKLGFLPGDLTQKVDPYLRPLYDALYDLLGFETVERLIEKNVIEIAPLAFMRGRTLNEAFIILDEAQNTTVEQMKMFLTRMGFNSRSVITGDITQCDLPKHIKSGLRDATEVLQTVKQVGFTFFKTEDVVRHNLVQKIIQAYDKAEKSKPK